MAFHVSRSARDRYRLDDDLFETSGRVIFADFRAARAFAQRINEQQSQAISASDFNALGLIHEVLHQAILVYRQRIKPDVMGTALTWLEAQFGKADLERTLLTFVELFPPVDVYRGRIDSATYLAGETGGISNRERVLEELVLLWLANANPAFAPFIELFDERPLAAQTVYRAVIASLERFFDEQPGIESVHEDETGQAAPPRSLWAWLREPMLKAPTSLFEQLQYLRTHWGLYFQEDGLLSRLMLGTDFIAEEVRAQEMSFFSRLPGGPGPGPVEAPVFSLEDEEEPERFSEDLDWMPRVVMMAKSTLVWLDQLSKKHKRSITRLDQIPDTELDQLATWGFTALWLIGIWERSPASKKIKQWRGNPEAEASAYALEDYIIAQELGGYQAYENLRDRCRVRGIRLASDMVPNHTGLDSKWVREHPEWFLQVPHPPYPSYKYESANLCDHPGYGVYLEDHYYDSTDAAVVFKWENFNTGDVRYIYHGNDGTSMPWNDTAQLDYLRADVREAVIQVILRVARMFPIIRFDAAMVLAKRHIHRLWYPAPGSGGGISSRAEFGLTRQELDAAMPEEFWREVVDRVAVEAPDTLLLAEAFWFMEGYFVRTLGMHRVYNSAFMHMFKNEENAKYREAIKNTLEFDPEILRRYVNFMNNPDEETAVAQFGKGDKYIGVCMVMLTMPGLPMFGHGQVEGLAEKYGMEYRRAYLDEQPDPHLIARHERELFPLMKRRRLFAGVEHFYLYDFNTPSGVDENVYAYSNRYGNERILVLYNNAYERTAGTIHESAAYAVKKGEGEKEPTRTHLGAGLGLTNEPDHYFIFRDTRTNLEYIWPSRQVYQNGLSIALDGYMYFAFLNFREVQDDASGRYAQLTRQLHGRGVPSMDEALRGQLLKPFHDAFSAAFEATDAIDDLFETQYAECLSEAAEQLEVTVTEADLAEGVEKAVQSLTQLDRLDGLATDYPWPRSRRYKAATALIDTLLAEDSLHPILMQALMLTQPIVDLGVDDETGTSLDVLDLLALEPVLQKQFESNALNAATAQALASLVRVLATDRDVPDEFEVETASVAEAMETELERSPVQNVLQVNTFDEVVWFNKERFNAWVEARFLVSTLLHIQSAEAETPKAVAKRIAAYHDRLQVLKKAEQASGYKVETLLDALPGKRRKKDEISEEPDISEGDI